jgi:hypothetical protein
MREKMIIAQDYALEIAVQNIARKVNIGIDAMAKLLLKETAGVELNGLEEALLDIKNGDITAMTADECISELDEMIKNA